MERIVKKVFYITVDTLGELLDSIGWKEGFNDIKNDMQHVLIVFDPRNILEPLNYKKKRVEVIPYYEQ